MKSGFFATLVQRRSAIFTGLAMAAIMTTAHATNLVTNGSFELTTNGGGQVGYNTAVTGWSVPPGATASYTFVFQPGQADGSGVAGQYGNEQLWGPGNGGAPGNNLGPSPDGGNYLAVDGAFQDGAVSQTLNGLTVGQTYEVSFYFAGAQQEGFTGATTEQFEVSLGSQSQFTPVLSNVSHGFTGWQYQAMDFTATSTSETLSFFAIGTPSGVPPMSLLDGVSVPSVPEPSSLALLMTGFAGVGGFVRMRLKKA